MSVTHTHTRTYTYPPLQSGIYRHYKGHLYQVLGYAHNANSRPDIAHDDVRVVYIGLEVDGAHDGPRIAVRNAVLGDDAFFDVVCGEERGDGVVCGYVLAHYGDELGTCWRHPESKEAVSRFTHVGSGVGFTP